MTVRFSNTHLAEIPDQNSESEPDYYQLMAYWKRLRGNRLYPSKTDIDQDALGALWDSCFLIAMDSATERQGLCFSYVGSRLMPMVTDNVAMSKLHLPRIEKCFDQVLEKHFPIFGEYEVIDELSQRTKYYCCMMPLGGARNITHIVGSLTQAFS